MFNASAKEEMLAELYPEFTETPVQAAPVPRMRVPPRKGWRVLPIHVEITAIALLVIVVSFVFVQTSQSSALAVGGTLGESEQRDVLSEDAREGVAAQLLGTSDGAADGQDVAQEQHPLQRMVTVDPRMPRPAVSARAYQVSVLGEGGTVLSERGADVVRPIASITKLVTALTAEERIGMDTYLFFVPEQQYYRAGDLLLPLLLRSNNTVAENIALYVGEQRFVAYMNAYAANIGMKDTSFGDASGLSPKNVSTAADVSVLAQFLIDEKQELLALSKQEEAMIVSMSGREWSMESNNVFAQEESFLGGKLGFTDEAGQTGLSIFSVAIDGGEYVLSVVVLGSNDWKQDTRTLLRWVERYAEVVDGSSDSTSNDGDTESTTSTMSAAGTETSVVQ
jgi:D-alanyl-D-alanine carboxypeptidase